MKRSAVVYGGLLALFSLLAWIQWTADPSPDVGEQIVLLQGQPEDVERIVWTTQESEAVLERKEDAKGTYYWVTYTQFPQLPEEDQPQTEDEEQTTEGDQPAEGEPIAEPATEPEEVQPAEPEVSMFKAGDKGDELIEAISPMMALRRLEATDEATLESIGLAESTGSMVITRKGRDVTLDLGGEAYGTRDMYMREVSSGEIYLIDDKLVRPLRYARTRLPDRTLWSVQPPEVVAAILVAGGISVEFSHENPVDPSAARWIRPDSPDTDDAQLNTWMGKAIGMRGSFYADPDDPPEDLQLQFQLTAVDEAGETETLEVLRQGEDGDWWGRSEHTRGLMKLLSGPTSDLADDADDLVSAP